MNVSLHRPSESRFIDVRGLRYHLRQWGPEHAEPARRLLMLHGWMDVSASFQFVVDALDSGWQVIAPDWRGYGRTDRANADVYWFPDYLADLDAIVDRVQPHEPTHLVGHSMGGNIALLYAGIRPQRVASVVNLEGVGLRATAPEQAPARYREWLDGVQAGGALRDYASLDEVARRLQRTNQRLSAERAAFLARHWAEPDGHGRFRVAADPAHRIVNPVLYRLEEAMACWRAIECPVFNVLGEESDVFKHVADAPEARAELERRFGAIARAEQAIVPGAGHMLHHDQPAALAALIDAFLQRQA